MNLLAGDIFLSKGPTVLLACKAASVRVATPPWPLLSDAEGRRRLVERLCDTLRLDSAEASWRELLEPADQPAAMFLAGLVAKISVVLQNITGHPVTRYRALPQREAQYGLALWEVLLPKTARAAGKAATDLVTAAAGSNGRADSEIPLKQVRDIVNEVTSAVGNGVVEVMLETAQRRGIPWHIVDPVWPMFAFGQGSAMKRMMTSIPETQGQLSTVFTKDKTFSLLILREAGFPVPSHEIVRSEDEAVAVAERLGYPVVVKPSDLLRSKGVSVNLQSPDRVRRAYREARALSGSILVEDHLPGLPYRILVVDGRALAAMRRSVPIVIGDGVRDVAGLIESTNLERDLLALETATGPRPIAIENFEDELEPCLTEQGLDMNAVPEAGQRVQLAFMAQTGRGGENLDVTDQVHPDNLAMAEQAARVLEVTIFGLDFMTDDISRSYKEGRCGINEVNVEPALSLHQRATLSPRDVVTPVFDLEFGPGGNGRIPIVCSLGSPDAEAFTLLESALSAFGQRAGLAAGDDLARVGRFLLPPNTARPRPAERLLADTRVDCALVALQPKDLDDGLSFDRCTACYLPRPLGQNLAHDRITVQHAKLVASELAETVILPLQDYDFWNRHLDFSKRRVILLSQSGESLPEAASRIDTELVELRLDPEINVFHHHDGHVDRLLVLDGEDSVSAADGEALLLAIAGLFVLGKGSRDIAVIVAAALRNSRPPATPQSQGKVPV